MICLSYLHLFSSIFVPHFYIFTFLHFYICSSYCVPLPRLLQLSSREVGRYLNTCVTSDASQQAALQYVKSKHGSLLMFVKKYRRVFEPPTAPPDHLRNPQNPGEFMISFKTPAAAATAAVA